MGDNDKTVCVSDWASSFSIVGGCPFALPLFADNIQPTARFKASKRCCDTWIPFDVFVIENRHQEPPFLYCRYLPKIADKTQFVFGNKIINKFAETIVNLRKLSPTIP